MNLPFKASIRVGSRWTGINQRREVRASLTVARSGIIADGKVFGAWVLRRKS